MTLRVGPATRRTDVSTALLGIRRLVGRHHARGWTGVCDLVGAWSGSPVTTLARHAGRGRGGGHGCDRARTRLRGGAAARRIAPALSRATRATGPGPRPSKWPSTTHGRDGRGPRRPVVVAEARPPLLLEAAPPTRPSGPRRPPPGLRERGLHHGAHRASDDHARPAGQGRRPGRCRTPFPGKGFDGIGTCRTVGADPPGSAGVLAAAAARLNAYACGRLTPRGRAGRPRTCAPPAPARSPRRAR